MKFVLVLAIVALAQAVPWIPEPRGEEWWIERHRSFVENTGRNANNVTVVFYGDSITEGWGGAGREVFDRLYAPLGTANYGIGGDRTEHLLFRISDLEVEGLHPKLVVLKIGTNNGDSVDDTVRGIKAVVDLLLLRLPHTKVLLLGVLPRNDAGWFTRVADINIKVSKFHDGNRVHFLDMWHHFATAFGVVDQSLYTSDQLHLEAPGYVEWANTMGELFNELLNSN
jgi:lysophospholipase L1-like esterase